MKAFLTGNEAVARGAYEGGCHIATAYPGTPSTEILENIAQYEEIYGEWCTNEKVALEVAAGASFAGARALVAMKHVGLNVAADPLFSLSYIGATGGLIIVSADDPGMHSSQNEQDNRNYAKFAKIPLLEPSDSQEAKDLTIIGFKISEEFDTPVLLRLTTRISHSSGIVELGERENVPVKGYVKDFSKRIILPSNARKLHPIVEERLIKLKEFSNRFEYNRIEKGSKVGIITDSISYQYVKEVFPEASILKITLTWPMPDEIIRKFADEVDELYVVEENDPFIEEYVRSMGIKVKGKEKIPIVGELNPYIVGVRLGKMKELEKKDTGFIPPRPPTLCPGCPHIGVFNVIRKLKLVATGDIGCYTLGAYPPLNALDTCVEMGASVGNAYGIQLAMKDDKMRKKVVAVIGDSTFFHSGITGLLNIIYNRGITKIIILDNKTTAMTGHQGHPGTGKKLKGEGKSIDLYNFIKGMGINVYKVNPFNLKEITDVLKGEIEKEEPSCIIAESPCRLLPISKKERYFVVLNDKCNGCKVCLKVGCPAISFDKKEKKAIIDKFYCVGCTLCEQVCPFGAIVKGE
uniref:Indolepyruvate oxidoreductase subunit IorA n=1 Tax=candidate division WOR-3 bacterium TaxID=2052148 RepID=A0A7C4Y5I7_UNCW3